MLVRNRKVDIHLAIGTGGIESPLGEMLFHGRAIGRGIVVELEQPLGQRAIVEPLGLEQIRHDSLVASGSHQVGNTHTLVFQTGGIEIGIEGKMLD